MKKVIFLDIDGVLQPFTQHRFKYDMDALMIRLAEEHRNDHFLKLNKYDVAAVFYDWWMPAVRYLHILCEELGAEIVLSSAWRESKKLVDMQTLMSIYGLDKYLTAFTPELDYPLERADEIRAYLNECPEIERFVAIDDAYISGYKREFPDNFVETRSRFERVHFEKAVGILTGSTEPYFISKGKKVFFLHLDSLFDVDKGGSREAALWYLDRKSDENKLLRKLKVKDIAEALGSWNRSSEWYLTGMCERFEASIVIPAAWSKGYSLELVKLLLTVPKDEPEIENYMVEVTSRHRKGAGHEIRAYLKAHPQIEEFVICENETDSPIYEMFPGKVVHWKRRQKDWENNRDAEDISLKKAQQLLACGEPIEEDHQMPGFFVRYDRW